MNSNLKRELAKFFAGVAANQTLTHWAFGLSDVLPFKLLVVTYTPALNGVAMIVWPLVAVALIRYGWMRR
jgi:hypothetical protein